MGEGESLGVRAYKDHVVLAQDGCVLALAPYLGRSRDLYIAWCLTSFTFLFSTVLQCLDSKTVLRMVGFTNLVVAAAAAVLSGHQVLAASLTKVNYTNNATSKAEM